MAGVQLEHLTEREKDRSVVAECLAELRQWEDFFAYPGAALLRKVDDRIATGDATGAARLIHQISAAISSHSYRSNPGEWEAGDESSNVVGEVVKGLGQDGASYRPYFEVLLVGPGGPATRAQTVQELRKLRRTQDRFVYEPVVVGSFEDAVLGTILNGSVQAVVIYDSIPFASMHNSPVLRQVLTDHLGAAAIKRGTGDYGLRLAQALKLIRPELDLYLLTDRDVEKTAGDPAASCVRRVFYQVEEPLELHLSILDGVLDRYTTPYFDNLQK